MLCSALFTAGHIFSVSGRLGLKSYDVYSLATTLLFWHHYILWPELLYFNVHFNYIYKT